MPLRLLPSPPARGTFQTWKPTASLTCSNSPKASQGKQNEIHLFPRTPMPSQPRHDGLCLPLTSHLWRWALSFLQQAKPGARYLRAFALAVLLPASSFRASLHSKVQRDRRAKACAARGSGSTGLSEGPTGQNQRPKDSMSISGNFAFHRTCITISDSPQLAMHPSPHLTQKKTGSVRRRDPPHSLGLLTGDHASGPGLYFQPQHPGRAFALDPFDRRKH